MSSAAVAQTTTNSPAIPVKRKRGRPRKGTTIEGGGPVPVTVPKEQVKTGYRSACTKIMAGAKRQHSVILTHAEAQSLAYGMRRLAELAKCGGTGFGGTGSAAAGAAESESLSC